MEQLRLYTFINFYLSSIQQGIQSAHVIHEMFNKYRSSYESSAQLFDWSKHHKTIIVLNGGANGDLTELRDFLAKEIINIEAETGKILPWSTFNEDDQSLGGVMTGVGIVLPESIFNAVSHVSRGWEWSSADGAYNYYPLLSATSALITHLKSCRLAG